jgi:hypothetical protein
MTGLDVIYKGNAFPSPTLMKNVATEYMENVYNPISHNTRALSVTGKVWDQPGVITTTFNKLTNGIKAWNNVFKTLY